MPVVNPPITMPFTYRLIGHMKGNGIGTWRSEWTIHQTSGIPQPTDPIIVAAKNYFIDNLRDDCMVDHLELRHVQFGDIPFSQQGGIWTSPVATPGDKDGIYGGNSSVQPPTGLEVVAFIELFTTSGKPGKQFLRQLLDLVDVDSTAGGEWKFSGGAAHVTPATFRGNSANNGLASGFFGSADPGFVVVHFSIKDYNLNPSANQPFSTPVTDFALVRPTLNKPTRKSKK